MKGRIISLLAVFVIAGCAFAIGCNQSKATPRVKALLQRLKSADPVQRTLAMMEIRNLEPAEKESAVSDLVEMTRDPNAAVRESAFGAFSGLGVQDESVIPLMVQALKDPSYTIRAYAAETLGGIGPAAKDQGAKALLTALKDPDYPVRDAARAALLQIDPAMATETEAAAAREVHASKNCQVAILDVRKESFEGIPPLDHGTYTFHVELTVRCGGQERREVALIDDRGNSFRPNVIGVPQGDVPGAMSYAFEIPKDRSQKLRLAVADIPPFPLTIYQTVAR